MVFFSTSVKAQLARGVPCWLASSPLCPDGRAFCTNKEARVWCNAQIGRGASHAGQTSFILDKDGKIKML